MAGGMYPRHMRPKAPRDEAARRHCWVSGPGVRHPGILLEWRKGEDGWWALVTFYVEADGACDAVGV